jgi:hypothetical protein
LLQRYPSEPSCASHVVTAVPRVDRRWPGSTIVCLATGPSLTAEDVDYCRGKVPVIAVNDAYRLAPWADALIAADASWWHAHQGVTSFAGEQWSIEHSSWARYDGRWPRIQRLQNTGEHGIETHPTGLRNGRNSGYLALNLAVLYGASRIVLLGYDMGSKGRHSHFFGHHPGAMHQHSPYPMFIAKFETAVAPLKALGIAVVNCSRATALTCFPRGELRQVLA